MDVEICLTISVVGGGVVLAKFHSFSRSEAQLFVTIIENPCRGLLPLPTGV